MDNKDQNEMPEYMKTLPQSVQDFIFGGVWEERTDEIAKKYSLNDTQTDNLINNILFILIGLDKPETFLETTIIELGISRLLAEQIMEDLEVRVFEYATKSIENKEKRGGSSQQVIASSKEDKNKLSTSSMPVGIPNIEDDIPEVRPEITPMVEKDEVVHDSSQQPVASSKENTGGREIPRAPLGQTSEPVQRPVSVPRYMGEQEEMTNDKFPMTNQDQNPNDKVDAVTQKASEPTPAVETKPIVEAVKPQEQPKTPEPVPEPPKKYTVDPYREPIE
jgi:hypothetical protein